MDCDEILWRDPGWQKEQVLVAMRITIWPWQRFARTLPSIIVVAWPDRVAGNGPQALGFIIGRIKAA